MRDKAKILVVDDTPANLDVMTETLSSAGYQVTIAISGERALNRLRNDVPDLILLDVKMPGFDGFETCRRIKENPNLSNIPIIFITVLSDTGSIVRGFTLGAVDYINTPFQELELLSRVNTHLRLQQLNSSQIQRVQQEKMSASDTLDAGVAHESNHPIEVMSGNVNDLKRNFQDVLAHLSLYQQQASAEEIATHAEEIGLDSLSADIPKMLDSMLVRCDLIRDISGHQNKG